MMFGHASKQLWSLDPSVTYLNHGTVGVVPRRVQEAQAALRERIERQPSRVLLREMVHMVGLGQGEEGELRRAASAVAAFVGARGPDVVFVDNATTGVNAVLRSLPLQPGDELLLTDHSYGAVGRAATFAAREKGASVRVVPVPYPRFDPQELVARVTAALHPGTRLVLADHVTSASALVLPVAEIAARCRERGVAVLVDGAHAPGMLELDVPSLGVDWYTANLHKWAHAPRSCGFLWAAPERQAGLHPPVISWGLDTGFTGEFDWVGTRDPSPFLAAPEGIAFLRELGEGEARRYRHDLVYSSAHELARRWYTRYEVPEACVGSMVTVPLPASLGRTAEDAARLRDALLFEDAVEVHVCALLDRLWARVSIQVYNEAADVERLAAAVEKRAKKVRAA